MRRLSEDDALRCASTGAPTDYLRCIACNALVACRLPALDVIRRVLKDELGFELKERRFVGYGYCRECRLKSD